MTGFDHLVLVVDDVERTLAWYGDVLGLEVLRADEWRAGEVFFPSLRVSEHTIIDVLGSGGRELAEGRQLLDHICLVIEPTDLDVLVARDDLDVVEGPTPRFGARGYGWSIYLRDPDGLLVELRHYGDTSAG